MARRIQRKTKKEKKRKPNDDKVIIYSDEDGDLWWKRVAPNGFVMMRSIAGFADRRNCLNNFYRSIDPNYYVLGVKENPDEFDVGI